MYLMYLEGKERDYFVPYAVLFYHLKCKLMFILQSLIYCLKV